VGRHDDVSRKRSRQRHLGWSRLLDWSGQHILGWSTGQKLLGSRTAAAAAELLLSLSKSESDPAIEELSGTCLFGAFCLALRVSADEIYSIPLGRPLLLKDLPMVNFLCDLPAQCFTSFSVRIFSLVTKGAQGVLVTFAVLVYAA
jgi:hypothetical protein